MSDSRKLFDLNERTSNFGKAVIELAAKITKNQIANPIVSQLVRSGTSIGANYREADCAESRKDFEHKLGLCKKEANETKYWLEMLSSACPASGAETAKLKQEADELHKIFIAIVKKSRENTSVSIRN